MHHTLTALGATDIDTWFVPKGANIHTTDATEALAAFKADALVVLDQGSRGGPPILPGVPTLILDHHQSTVFPDEAQASSMNIHLESKEGGEGWCGQLEGPQNWVAQCHEAPYCITTGCLFESRASPIKCNLTCILWPGGCAFACNNSHMCLCASHCCVTATASGIASLQLHCWKQHIQLILSLCCACLHYTVFSTSQSLQDQTHVLHKSSLMQCIACTICKDLHCTVSLMHV